MVNPDPGPILFSPSVSYHTSRLPINVNNNKITKSPPYILQYSRKRSSNNLPPIGPNSPRSRLGRVRTVPSSRANSSKQQREGEQTGQIKRSRSASEEPWQQQNDHASSTIHLGGSNLEIRGNESQIHRDSLTSQQNASASRPRRLTKVETIRVLRARSALLLPLPPPALPPHPSFTAGSFPSHPSPLTSQPLLLKSEERKKKRR